MRKLSIILIFLVTFILTLSVGVFAINSPSGAQLTQGNSDAFTETSAASIVATGGNVTTLNLESNLSTSRWQGFVGNVTGNLYLGRGTNVLYDFGVAVIDTVFATTESGTFDWANLAAATVSEIDTQWSFSSGVDQAIDIFTNTGTFEGVSSVPYVSLNGGFLSMVFDDGGAVGSKSDLVFGANVSESTSGFDGGIYDYELIVPTTDSGTDTYYFYLSLE